MCADMSPWRLLCPICAFFWRPSCLRCGRSCCCEREFSFILPPPAGQTCFRCYCCCCLAPSSNSNNKQANPEPHFYVNVADCSTLENMERYVACTTERIFERKHDLYDLYVDGRDLRASCAQLCSLLLPSHRWQATPTATATAWPAPKRWGRRGWVSRPFATMCALYWFIFWWMWFSYFRELNTRLFTVLYEAADSQRSDHLLTHEDMLAMELGSARRPGISFWAAASAGAGLGADGEHKLVSLLTWQSLLHLCIISCVLSIPLTLVFDCASSLFFHCHC